LLIVGVGLQEEVIALVEGREAITPLLKLDDVIDLVIPRGISFLSNFISCTTCAVFSHLRLLACFVVCERLE